MPTDGEIKAATAVVERDVLALIKQFVPSFFMGQVNAAFKSAQGQKSIHDTTVDALMAAEKVRNAPPKVAS